MKVHKLSRPQVVDEEVLQAIEERIAAARRGEVVDIVFACNDAHDGAFYRASDFQVVRHFEVRDS